MASEYSTAENHTMALVSLGLGIASFVIIPLIGSIGAIITGNMALKEIAANPTQYKGEQLAKIGRILGWVNIGLMLCGVIAVILLAVLGVFAGVAGA